MYQNTYSFTENRVADVSQMASLQATAHALEPKTALPVSGNVVDELRNEAARALFSLGAWIAPRKTVRPSVPVQLRRTTANGSIAG